MSSKSATKSSSGFGIKTLDVLGSKFKIGYPTTTGKLQTTLGGYLTILMGLLSTTMFIIVMSQFFNNDSPVVMTSSEFGSRVTVYDLYTENLYPIIVLYVGPKQIPANQISRYVTIKAFVDSIVFKADAQADASLDISSYRVFDYKTCGDLQDPLIGTYVKELSNQTDFGQLALCPDFKGQQADFKVDENFETHKFKWVTIRMFPCSLPDQSQCASAQEIDLLRADYSYPFKLLEPSDGEKPMRSAPYMKSNRIDRRSVKISKQLITSNKVMDDTVSTLTPPKLNIEYATMKEDSLDFSSRDQNQLHCSEQEVLMREAGPCREYIMWEYNASKEVIITRRSYKKITTMLGEFGGIFKILTSMVFVFYGLYSMGTVKTFVGDIIFGKDQASREELKKLIEQDLGTFGSRPTSNNKFSRTKIFGEPQNELENAKRTKIRSFGSSASAQPKMEEIVESLVNKRSKVDDLMRKLSLIDLIEKAVFTESQRPSYP